jgi:hypothetical protein
MDSAEVDPFPSSLENPEKEKKERGLQTGRKKLSRHDGFGSNSRGGTKEQYICPLLRTGPPNLRLGWRYPELVA